MREELFSVKLAGLGSLGAKSLQGDDACAQGVGYINNAKANEDDFG